MGYNINQDGTVTRNNVPSKDYSINSDGSVTRNNGPTRRNGGDDNNSGCIWTIIIIVVCIVIGVIIAINSCGNEEVEEEYIGEAPIEECEEAPAEDFYADNVDATYLNVSDDDVYFDADGGSVTINVSTDGDWEIGTSTASWAHIYTYSSSLELSVDEYSGSSDRTDWFTIKAGDYERRIDITQWGSSEPSASIKSVWVDHNQHYNGYKGMLIHIKFTTENLLNQTVYVYAYFYYEDNVTSLHNQYGDDIYFYGTGNNIYTSSTYEDFRIFVPYDGLNMAPGSYTLSFDIVVKCNGSTLARDENNQFNLNKS